MDDLKLPKLPEPCIRPFPGADPYYFAEEQLRAAQLEAWKAAVEACARRCDQIEDERWSVYKDSRSSHAGSDFVQGQSDGACQCATRIRSMPLPKGDE